MKVRQIVLTVTIAVCGLTAIILNYNGAFEAYAGLKLLTTSLIIVFPLFLGSQLLPKFPRFTFLGLVFCLIGDALLLFDDYFIFGLISFLIGHCLFILAFINYGGFRKPAIPGLLLIAIGVTYYTFLYPHLGSLAMPVLMYFAIILVMCWQGVTLRLRNRNKPFVPINIAVVFFVVSDAVLAYNRFVEPFDSATFIILATYWLSIYLLSFSINYSEVQR